MIDFVFRAGMRAIINNMEKTNEAFTDLMSRDHRLWSLAIETAAKSEFPKFRVGAVISHRWKIISRQHNKEKTHTKASEYWSKGRHAEFDALRAADGDGETIAVVRLSQDGDLLDSIPCWRCMKRIRNSGIKWVICMINGEVKKCMASELFGHVPQPATKYGHRFDNAEMSAFSMSRN